MLWYTDSEIIYDVKHALNPYQQISILAELNGVERKEIEKVLKRHKIKLPPYQRQTCNFAKLTQRGEREVTEDHKKRREQKHDYYVRNRERILAREHKRYERLREELERGKER